MKQGLRFLFSFIIVLNAVGCTGPGDTFPETFESSSKEGYAYGELQLQSGKWVFDNALIGRTSKDHKNGTACVRMRGKASIEMQFDIATDIRLVTIAHATYATDAPSKWELLYSTDQGNTWQGAGAPTNTSRPEMAEASFTINAHAPIRFKIQKSGGGRLNIDDISLNNNTAVLSGDEESASRDDNMALGNPSKASNTDKDNYLITRPRFALSYNNSRGTANWVSWHLSTAWKGVAERCNCFAPDDDLPGSYFKVNTSDYIATGFDRGPLCPSDDRDGTSEDNAATFLMTNIAPQAPNLNRDTWEKLESYCRKLITEGNELYIVAGTYGKGGEGSKGSSSATSDGAITVPARFWKVIVILPAGDKDAERIDNNTRVIAVDMPNTQAVNTYDWKHYRTTVDTIESATGLDLLSNLPLPVQGAIEAQMDAGPAI